MGFRFRRAVKISPGLRLNLSKGGLSLSAGVRGASMTFGTRGAYGNIGLPGTGLSYRGRLGGKSRKSQSRTYGQPAGGERCTRSVPGKKAKGKSEET